MSTGLLTRDRGTGPGVAIDPRLRERRAEIARDAGRRRRRRLLAAGVVLALVAAGFGLTRSALLDVDEVVVHGAARTGEAEVRRAAGIEPGRPMTAIDPGAAADRLEDLPWVQDATVERDWPGTVTISLTERTAVALVGTGGRSRFVDRTGRVLGDAPVGAVLPRVAGTAPPAGGRLPKADHALLDTLADLPAELATQVAEARRSSRGLSFRLDDDVVVAWGAPGQTSAKADALLLLLAQADRPTIDRVDVSVPSAPALTRRDGGGA